MYTILKFRDNIDVSLKHPSFGTFDVLVEMTDTHLEKWVSIPHELFFEYLKHCNTGLYDYVEKSNFVTWEDAIKDLYGIGYEFGPDMLRYITTTYNKFIFETMANYNPDFFINDDFEHGTV